WTMQFLADVLAVPVEVPADTETTVLGAAYLAGLGAGMFGGLDDIGARWRAQRRFEPAMDAARRDALYAGWLDAVARVRAAASS
ncbi:MAG: FGGY-family carbohydrate kinase, partial [Magnetovibrio sp.]|nr:FGGY-family carbohydrate kinase [Magnetovibrio sp.]